ncbi:MAG: hypothetical protein EPO07_14045 [Verrucomicrobia bacterium]|nr:MAG: hypothetical protein EPO07_14045 [Verrucomicrobiota bacterium]
MNVPPQTEIEKKRAAWWPEHVRPGMPLDKVLQLNEELRMLHPQTPEEREQKTRDLEAMGEFVL